ncbi:MAG: sn-glycerol-3-phosphate ABC transporter ATP-binding protein UgpC [FCB group bacterium]|nr:sn-glycerol-3-phosphate ABC transporter ATP-binding protein UgpC [FCB group bacterium]
MASLQLRNIRKTYTPEVPVIDNFNLKIDDGEFIVLVGPSGCGKSTILRIISGLEDVSQGEIFIGGKQMNSVPPKDRNVAMVFQNYALYPHMTVFENMAFGLRLRKIDRQEIRRRVSETAQTLKIEDLLFRKPKALSGGQRQRVALGRAIVRQPRVFLFDEPLSNLDAKLRVQMRAEIKRLHQQLKTTMIYVTHDQIEAMTMGDRIVILKDGFVQQIGTPTEVYREPTNVFVGSFIGSPAMNIFPGIWHDGQFSAHGFTLDLSMRKVDFPENSEVLLGIRPGDIKIGKSEILAEILVIEPLGYETILHLQLGNESSTVIVKDIPDYKTGSMIGVKLAIDKCFLFARESGKRIL